MSNSPFDPNSPLFPWYQPPVAPRPARPSLGDLLAKIQPDPPVPSWADLLVKQPKPSGLGNLFGTIPLPPTRPRIFVSYQHSSDQYYYNEFIAIPEAEKFD